MMMIMMSVTLVLGVALQEKSADPYMGVAGAHIARYTTLNPIPVKLKWKPSEMSE